MTWLGPTFLGIFITRVTYFLFLPIKSLLTRVGNGRLVPRGYSLWIFGDVILWRDFLGNIAIVILVGHGVLTVPEIIVLDSWLEKR